MSLLINIENYEAFYLDFIEGNLIESDKRAFISFLKNNPDLVEDEDLVFLSVPNFDEKITLLDTDFLSQMKIFDESAIISPENYEQFMIASVEKVISESKELELCQFVSQDVEYKNDFNLFQQTILKVNQAVIFDEKNNLKQLSVKAGGIVIPLYAKLLSIAAALILIFMLYPSDEQSFNTQRFASSSKKIKQSVKEKKTEQQITAEVDEVEQLAHQSQVISTKKANIETQSKLIELAFFGLKLRGAEKLEIDSKLKNIEIIPTDFASLVNKKSKPVFSTELEVNSSYLAFSEMKNPAKIITSSFAERFKTKVDFRTAKASKKKQGGFYIKIGKFEISRKTAPQDVLAVN